MVRLAVLLMLGWCEIEDGDAPDKQVRQYAVWTGAVPGFFLMWLCAEHSALLTPPTHGSG